MTRGRPVLDPERDLKGATPETLARALLRNENLELERSPRPEDQGKKDAAPCTKP